MGATKMLVLGLGETSGETRGAKRAEHDSSMSSNLLLLTIIPANAEVSCCAHAKLRSGEITPQLNHLLHPCLPRFLPPPCGNRS